MDNSAQPQFAPHDVDAVVAQIKAEKPRCSSRRRRGDESTDIILPDDYIKKVAAAMHAHEGLFVLDCIASGTVWVDMKDTGVDCILSAPQKGWTGPACASLMMLSERGDHAAEHDVDVHGDQHAQVAGDGLVRQRGFAYYTTMPTDALNLFRDAALETKEMGFKKAADAAWRSNEKRDMMKSKGLRTVSAPGFEAPGVSVWYTDQPDMFAKFKAKGFQIAAGVPFMINEPPGTTSPSASGSSVWTRSNTRRRPSRRSKRRSSSCWRPRRPPSRRRREYAKARALSCVRQPRNARAVRARKTRETSRGARGKSLFL